MIRDLLYIKNKGIIVANMHCGIPNLPSDMMPAGGKQQESLIESNDMKLKRTSKIGFQTKTLLGLTAAGLFAGSVAFANVANTIVVVTPGNMNGWSFLTTDNTGAPAPGNGNTAQMVTGPATPPLGVGSAQLATAPGQGDSSAQIVTSAFNGLSLSSLSALSYYTYDTANNGQQFPYMKISLSNGDDLFFEPPYQTPATGNPALPDQGATVMNQWQQWNALVGGWWDNNGIFNPGVSEPGSPGVDSIANYITAAGDATITGISLRVGYASPDDNFNGYVDSVTINNTTYDFEPGSAVVPDSGSAVMLLGCALAALGAFSRRRVAS